MYTAVAVLENPGAPDKYIHSIERFLTEAQCLTWINSNEGDLFAASATLDTKNEPDLAGYSLDDIIPEKLQGRDY